MSFAEEELQSYQRKTDLAQLVYGLQNYKDIPRVVAIVRSRTSLRCEDEMSKGDSVSSRLHTGRPGFDPPQGQRILPYPTYLLIK